MKYRKAIGPYIMPFAYAAAGIILVFGAAWLTVKVGLSELVEALMEME